MVVAAGAVNTAVILLDSANAAHPNGLANGSDQVGRNYAFHTLSAMVSLTVDRRWIVPQDVGGERLLLEGPGRQLRLPHGPHPAAGIHDRPDARGQVSDWLPPALVPDVLINAAASRMLSMLVISEDLPLPDNRVRVTPDGRITLDYAHNNLEGHHRLVKRLHQALEGFVDHAHPIWQHHFELDSPVAALRNRAPGGHDAVRDDPKSSVLDACCKAHELDNLYVVDSSFFVSSAAVNPTLTIVANAMRIGDHLMSGWARRAPPPQARSAPRGRWQTAKRADGGGAGRRTLSPADAGRSRLCAPSVTSRLQRAATPPPFRCATRWRRGWPRSKIG